MTPKTIKRNQYLNRLISEKDNELIKIISGIRRSGKTYILKMFKEHLLSMGVKEEQILYMNFESFSNEDFLDSKILYQHVIKQSKIGKKLYLLFDEIQMVINWQKVINSLRVDIDVDIYITGSNASLLSGELATLITGRYTEIKVFPLSFKEYLDFKSISPDDRPQVYSAYQDYFKYGGMPTSLLLDTEEQKFDYLSSIYDSIILKDISSRQNGIKNVDALQKVALFLMDSIGSEISVQRMENRMKQNKVMSSRPTIANYLRLMEEAFVFYHSPKYDVKGAKQFSTNGKYYIADVGLWNSQLRIDTDFGKKLENIVYIELLRRKYTVQTGSYRDKEIDFVATKNNIRQYYQVAYNIPENSTRETDNLLQVPDNYEKILITNQQPENFDVQGLKLVNIIDWLLD